MSENNSSIDNHVENKANSIVLSIVLLINISLLLYGTYLAGNIVATIGQVNIIEGMWASAKSGTFVNTAGILVCLLIFICHLINNIIGSKSRITERVISILLRLPVNFILIILAMFFGWSGYIKFSIGDNTTNLLGGGFVLDWLSACALLYLVFGIKKI